eukprot:CAMPEP_0119522578 /NCGR_PEP_ID=MMETSP1344-20130328/37876_1 /TAXON_ID=236787 /ORGANISM="Florenciella parvula, Strain CCMP2471" /LENGTH=216 /DNA_ID=CAMNT_0007560625 /DNA_START=66 /DNA_END=716 /DNA_ORIENTATION=-
MTASSDDVDDLEAVNLHTSAQFGQPKEILEQLANGADINAYNSRGRTPLHAAAGRDAYIHQLLVDRGADVNARTKDGEDNTVLILLAQYAANAASAADRVEALIEHGAIVNSQNAKGDTAMHWAARRGDLQLVLLLLDNGGDPNLRESKFGRSPLHEAGMHGHSHVLHEMVKRGADMSMKDSFGDGKTATEYIDLMTQHNENKRNGRASKRNGGEL